MNKRRDHMEKMVTLLLIAYAVGLWLGRRCEKLFACSCNWF